MTFAGREFSPSAADLRALLVDVADVCGRLGLREGAQRQRDGLLIRCPWHADRSPSCSVRIAADGTIGVHCFGCGTNGDVLDLVAVASSLDPRGDFSQVLRHAAEIAGRPKESTPPRSPRLRARSTTQNWPPAAEVRSLWSLSQPVGEVPEVAIWLRSRGLDPAAVEDGQLARALPTGTELPRWAWYDGTAWAEKGYRCLLPMFDDTGALRSVRVRSLADPKGPKALPPTGHTLRGLVMADALGRAVLATGRLPDLWPARIPLRIVFAEGEPDFLTWATAFPDSDATAPAVFGVVAGSWTAGLAARVPDGARVTIRTHHDERGEQYARDIADTLIGRCTVLRGGARGCGLCTAFGWTGGAP
jgi:hypothetical protein